MNRYLSSLLSYIFYDPELFIKKFIRKKFTSIDISALKKEDIFVDFLIKGINYRIDFVLLFHHMVLHIQFSNSDTWKTKIDIPFKKGKHQFLLSYTYLIREYEDFYTLKKELGVPIL